ncbi:MAG: phospholipase D family protein [Polaromonas sp.]
MNSTVLTGKTIAAAIRSVRPQRIAVAYLGADWSSFLGEDLTGLDSIVISPRLGTNPLAVSRLVKALSTLQGSGWERVFFHDDLHAKLYLGKDAAVFGSANLSSNGLQGNELVELCTRTCATEDMQALADFYDSVLSQAKAQYPTEAKRKKRLADLADETQRLKAAIGDGVASGPSPDNCEAQQFHDFELRAPDQFYVNWYQPQPEPVFTASGQTFESKINDWISMASDDKPVKGKWVLCWRMSNSNQPDGRVKPHWMLIDEVIPDGIFCEDGIYTQLVIQRNDLNRRSSWLDDAPFALTDPVIKVLRSALADESLHEFLVQPDEVFNLKKSTKGVPELIACMKAKLDL